GQAPDRLHRGVVQDGVEGGIGDRDGADRPVGPDDDLDVDRAAEPAPARGERIAQRLLDARAESPEIGAVLGSGATRAAGTAARDRESKAVTHIGRATGSAAAHTATRNGLALDPRPSALRPRSFPLGSGSFRGTAGGR